MIIELDHLSKSFARKSEVGGGSKTPGVRNVLVDLSLNVDKGEVVCIMGRNGSGKTTLVRILCGLLEPDKGSARVCGFDVTEESGEVKRRVGVMLNAGEGGFHPRLSGTSNLEYYSALYKIPKKEAKGRIESLLRAVELADRGSDQYQSYSSGMRRRMALVRALLPNPPVLLLDEPTLGTDPWSTESIHKLLTSLSDSGKTILCMTNSPLEASALRSSVFLLENGSTHPERLSELVSQ